MSEKEKLGRYLACKGCYNQRECLEGKADYCDNPERRDEYNYFFNLYY